VNVAFGALQKLCFEVFEDEREAIAAPLDRPHGHQSSGAVSAAAEDTEVHRTEVIAGAPAEPNANFAVSLVDRQHFGPDEKKKWNVEQAPEPD
jgi:hypothetical protein